MNDASRAVRTGRLLRLGPDEERKLLMDALARAGGNQRIAGELLGISRRTLTSRLNECEFPRPRKGQTSWTRTKRR